MKQLVGDRPYVGRVSRGKTPTALYEHLRMCHTDEFNTLKEEGKLPPSFAGSPDTQTGVQDMKEGRKLAEQIEKAEAEEAALETEYAKAEAVALEEER